MRLAEICDCVWMTAGGKLSRDSFSVYKSSMLCRPAAWAARQSQTVNVATNVYIYKGESRWALNCDSSERQHWTLVPNRARFGIRNNSLDFVTLRAVRMSTMDTSLRFPQNFLNFRKTFRREVFECHRPKNCWWHACHKTSSRRRLFKIVCDSQICLRRTNRGKIGLKSCVVWTSHQWLVTG